MTPRQPGSRSFPFSMVGILLQRRTDIRIFLIYLTVSVLWILFSDRALFSLYPDLQAVQRIGTIKGLVFVVANGLLLFWLLRREFRQREKWEQDLVESRSRLRALAARLDEVREEERVGLSREIHDGLGQLLTGIKIDLSLLNRFLGGKPEGEVGNTLASLSRLVDETMTQTRALARQLRPGMLDEVGLAEAIRQYALEYEKRSGIRCTTNLMPMDTELSPRQRLALYRITQEALTNVARHAEAQLVEIDLHFGSETVTLRIHDDGKGLRPEDRLKPDSLGIVGMTERAELLGGSCRVLPGNGRGTLVVVEVPQKTDVHLPSRTEWGK